jgi:hypothetical protein
MTKADRKKFDATIQQLKGDINALVDVNMQPCDCAGCKDHTPEENAAAAVVMRMVRLLIWLEHRFNLPDLSVERCLAMSRADALPATTGSDN